MTMMAASRSVLFLLCALLVLIFAASASARDYPNPYPVNLPGLTLVSYAADAASNTTQAYLVVFNSRDALFALQPSRIFPLSALIDSSNALDMSRLFKGLPPSSSSRGSGRSYESPVMLSAAPWGQTGTVVAAWGRRVAAYDVRANRMSVVREFDAGSVVRGVMVPKERSWGPSFSAKQPVVAFVTVPAGKQTAIQVAVGNMTSSTREWSWPSNFNQVIASNSMKTPTRMDITNHPKFANNIADSSLSPITTWNVVYGWEPYQWKASDTMFDSVAGTCYPSGVLAAYGMRHGAPYLVLNGVGASARLNHTLTFSPTAPDGISLTGAASSFDVAILVTHAHGLWYSIAPHNVGWDTFEAVNSFDAMRVQWSAVTHSEDYDLFIATGSTVHEEGQRVGVIGYAAASDPSVWKIVEVPGSLAMGDIAIAVPPISYNPPGGVLMADD